MSNSYLASLNSQFFSVAFSENIFAELAKRDRRTGFILYFNSLHIFVKLEPNEGYVSTDREVV